MSYVNEELQILMTQISKTGCSKREFTELLKNHDWDYGNANSLVAWSRGVKTEKRIKQIVELGGIEYKEIYDLYKPTSINI